MPMNQPNVKRASTFLFVKLKTTKNYENKF